MTEKHPGRPTVAEQETNDARGKLLSAARHCFLHNAYEKVTTRQISEQAGVNKSQINYYFGGKEALFKEAIFSIAAPVLNEFKRARREQQLTIDQIVRHFMQIMSQYPEFPQLLMKIITSDNSPLKNELIDNVVRAGALEIQQTLETYQQEGRLDPTLDPQLLVITLQTMMVSPLLLRPVLERAHRRELDPETLKKLAEQNIQLFNLLITSAPPSC